MIEYTVKIYKTGRQEWLLDGQLHKEDGPAVIHGDYRAWYLNGKRHKEDDPAIIFSNGDKEYWINGKQLSEDEFNNRNTKELSVAEINELLGFKVKVVDK